MTSPLQDYIARFNAEVVDRASGADGEDPRFKETAFTELMLERLEDPIGATENALEAYFDGPVDRGRAKVNGYAVNDDNDALDLFVTLFRNASDVVPVPTDEIKRAVEQALRYYRGAASGVHQAMEPSGPAFDMSARIHALRDAFKRVRVLVLTDGVAATSKSRAKTISTGSLDVRFEVWDMERLSRALAFGTPHEEIDVDVAEVNGAPLVCVEVPVTSPTYRSFLTAVPGGLLYRLYEEYGPRLLERNVRSFLQAKGKVNRGIRDTLAKTPSLFMAYNNGISLTAEAVDTVKLADGSLALTRLKGLQVVNGGQTTASIHRVGKAKVDLSAVYVQAKITVVEPHNLDELAPKIAEFANTQNPIQMADFSANDPFHIEIERLSQQIWMPGEQGKWFYERARGQYQVAKSAEATTDARARQFTERTPPSRRFSKTDLAKFVNAWGQLPNLVSYGAQKNFVFFTQRFAEVHPKSWKPDVAFYKELIAKAILFSEATRIVKKENFPSYKAQIVAYTIALLSFRSGGQFDLMHVWTQQRLSASLEEMLREWTHVVAEAIRASAGDRNVTEWCKKPECWRSVKLAAAVFKEPMPPELQTVVVEGGRWGDSASEVRVPVDPDDLAAIAVCRSTDASDWIRILEWANESGRLDGRQREFVSTLGANAASGWQKELSPKRAQEGRAILKMASDNGVLADRALAVEADL